MGYYIAFFLIAVALIAAIFSFIDANTEWGFYPVWLITLNIATFMLYEIDKLMSMRGGARTPEAILHLLALLGGFGGGWLGMIALPHKINFREHPDFYAFLTLGTIAHGAFIWYRLTASG